MNVPWLSSHVTSSVSLDVHLHFISSELVNSERTFCGDSHFPVMFLLDFGQRPQSHLYPVLLLWESKDKGGVAPQCGYPSPNLII